MYGKLEFYLLKEIEGFLIVLNSFIIIILLILYGVSYKISSLQYTQLVQAEKEKPRISSNSFE